MIKAIVSYRMFYTTYTSELLTPDAATLFAEEHKDFKPQIRSYEIGQGAIARGWVSRYNKLQRAREAVDRAAAANRQNVQSTREMKARGRSRAAEQEFHNYCRENNLPVAY